MSDNESDYYSESPSESDEESVHIVSKKPGQPVNAASKFGNYAEDPDIDDSEPDDADDAEEEDEDEQDGGADDDELEEGEIKEDDEPDDAEVEEDDEQDDDIEIDEDGEPIEKTVKPTKQIKPKKTAQLIIDDEDENEDEYDENYLQKFDSDLNKNYISEFHAECLNHNYDEVLKLAKVTKDSNNIIIDQLHRTVPYLTKYEKARVLGQRAKQIETGAKPLVKVPENIVDGYVIAELELREKKIPFIIRRPIPGGAFEYWHLRDLEIISF